jgi:hypothetical protein
LRVSQRYLIDTLVYSWIYLDIDQMKNETSMFKEENMIKYPNNELSELIYHQLPTSLTIPEDGIPQNDVADYGFHSFMTGSRPKFSGLAPPPVAPRRSRQNSACSTQSSVRYAS